MKTMLNRKKTMVFVVASIAFLTVNIIACKKMSEADPKKQEVSAFGSPTVSAAQNFFKGTILQNEKKEGLARTKKTNGGGAIQRQTPSAFPARMSKIADLIRWDGSFETAINGKAYLLVPLNEATKPFKNKEFEFLRYLVFSDKDGSKDLSVIEILSDKGTSLGTNGKEIAQFALSNKLNNDNKPIEGLNASVIFFTGDYMRETSFHIANGNWKFERISFRSDLEIRLK